MSDQPKALRLADRLEGRWALHPEMQEAAAELRRLHAENEALQNTKHYEAPRGFVLNPDYLVPELQAQRDALLADAERYRWLRDNVYAGVNRHNECLWAIRGLYEKDGQSFDAAIDAVKGDK